MMKADTRTKADTLVYDDDASEALVLEFMEGSQWKEATQWNERYEAWIMVSSQG
jgi:hypothetical protein